MRIGYVWCRFSAQLTAGPRGRSCVEWSHSINSQHNTALRYFGPPLAAPRAAALALWGTPASGSRP